MSQQGESIKGVTEELQDEIKNLSEFQERIKKLTPSLDAAIIIRASKSVIKVAERVNDLFIQVNAQEQSAKEILSQAKEKEESAKEVSSQAKEMLKAATWAPSLNEELQTQFDQLKIEKAEVDKKHEELFTKSNSQQIEIERLKADNKRLSDLQKIREQADSARELTLNRKADETRRRAASTTPERAQPHKRPSLGNDQLGSAIRNTQAEVEPQILVTATPAPEIKVESSVEDDLATIKAPNAMTEDQQHQWTLFTTQFKEVFGGTNARTRKAALSNVARKSNAGCVIARGRNLVGGSKRGTDEKSKCAHCSKGQNSSYVCIYLNVLDSPDGDYLYRAVLRT